MSRLRRLLTASALAPALCAAVATTTAFSGAAAAEEALTKAQQDAVRALVRDTLVNNPDILREAFAALQAQEEARQASQQAAAVQAHAKALYATATDPVLGNPKGDVTLVEFFDYRCGYCKAVMDTVMDVVESDGNVRFVLKEFPILGPESRIAARFALAAREQGKYQPFHLALMAHRGAYSEQAIKTLAKDAGLDIDKLAKDAASPEIQAELEANHALAQALGINGTPAFAVGSVLMPGAVDADTLKQAISQARKDSKG